MNPAKNIDFFDFLIFSPGHALGIEVDDGLGPDGHPDPTPIHILNEMPSVKASI
jgi:hypothetical protein